MRILQPHTSRTRRLQITLALPLLVILWMAPRAGADSILLNSGFISARLGGSYIYDVGGASFSFQGSAIDPLGFSCSLGCRAGSTANMGYTIFGGDIRGTATLGSETSSVPPRPGPLFQNSRFNFHGISDIPLSAERFLTLTHPFTFDGTLQTTDFGLLSLQGKGLATLTLRMDNPGFYYGVGSRYEFTTAPEPSTLLFVASGLGGLFAWRLRKKPAAS
jgi:hypothetical protein